jgi:hypothetical protein
VSSEEETVECLPCKIGKNLCRLLDKDKSGKCTEIYEAVLSGKISGSEGKRRLEQAYGAEKVTEALKTATEIEKRVLNYKRAMLDFLKE